MNRRGFTLLEVLIVIAILLTLAALVYVLLAPVREKSRETHCISNLRQIGQAVTMYRADYQGRPGNPQNALQRLGVPNLPTGLIEAGYFKWSERSVFICPSDWRQDPSNPGLIVSYYWPAGDHDGALPGTDVKEGASYRRLRQLGDAVAIAIDPWHYDPNHQKEILGPEYAARIKDEEKFWLILRLGGWVERIRSRLPKGSSSDL